MNTKTGSTVLTALFAALLCVAAPFSLQIGPVPISLATLAVYFTAMSAKLSIALPATAVYILLGAVGVPVFSGFEGGFQKLVGVTGGYIIGYIPCVLVIGLLLKFCDKKIMLPISCIVGTAVLYAFGTAWFLALTGKGVLYALGVCVVPFLLGDAVKIAAACGLTLVIKPRLEKIFY